MTTRFKVVSDGDPFSDCHLEDQTFCRKLNSEQLSFFEYLQEQGVLAELESLGLLTKVIIKNHNYQETELVLEFPEVEQLLDWSLLCPSLRKDIALKILDIELALGACDLTLVNHSAKNFGLNKFGTPCLHNIFVIGTKKHHVFLYDEFFKYYFAPLILVDERKELISLIFKANNVSVAEFFSIRYPKALTVINFFGQFSSFGKLISSLHNKLFMQSPIAALIYTGNYFAFMKFAFLRASRLPLNSCGPDRKFEAVLLRAMRAKINLLSFRGIVQRWTSYHDKLDFDLLLRSDLADLRSNFGSRTDTISKILSNEQNGTLVDLGANNGFFSILAARLGFSVVALDHDQGAINRLYDWLKKTDHHLHIQPLTFDFVKFADEHNDHQNICGDVVLALGFLHHMRRVEFLKWEVIAKKLSEITGKLLVTEFKPDTGATSANELMAETVIKDYQLPCLLYALEKYFSSVEVFGDRSMPGGGQRTLILCKK